MKLINFSAWTVAKMLMIRVYVWTGGVWISIKSSFPTCSDVLQWGRPHNGQRISQASSQALWTAVS